MRSLYVASICCAAIGLATAADTPAPTNAELDKEIKVLQASLAEKMKLKNRNDLNEVQSKLRYPGHKLNLEGYFEAARNFGETSSLKAKMPLLFSNDAGIRLAKERIGKPPPVYKWKLNNGGVLDLEELKGKKNVVLGFWSLPCVDCVITMPYIADIADAYKDKDVAVYLVNFFAENTDFAKNFLKQQDFNYMPSALGNGAFGGGPNNYGIGHRMPLTYVIGKDGLTKAVHLIRDHTLVDIVSKELDLLLEGKELPPVGEINKMVAAKDAAVKAPENKEPAAK